MEWNETTERAVADWIIGAGSCVGAVFLLLLAASQYFFGVGL